MGSEGEDHLARIDDKRSTRAGLADTIHAEFPGHSQCPDCLNILNVAEGVAVGEMRHTWRQREIVHDLYGIGTHLGEGRILRLIGLIHPDVERDVIGAVIGEPDVVADAVDVVDIIFMVYPVLQVDKGGTATDLMYFRGRIKQRLGLIEEAEKSFQAAIKLDSQYVDCLQSLAMIYLNTGRYVQAIDHFRRVTNIDSAYYPGWIGLGASLSLDGLTPQADTVLDRLFAVDSAMGFQMLNIISTNYAKQKKTEQQ